MTSFTPSRGSRQKRTWDESYQPTLYNLRFGSHLGSNADDSAKRVRSDEQVKKANVLEADRIRRHQLSSATNEKEKKHSKQASKGSGINGEDLKQVLKPVTKESFLEQYAVEKMKHIYYKRDWIDAKTAHRWRKELSYLPEWYRPKLKVYGREIQQSREIAAYSTAPGLELKYSGHQVEMHSPFPPLLEEIAERLSSEDCLGEEVKFNHAMLNSYQDGNVYIGKHSDNVENKVIVTVSLGAPRTWVMEEKTARGSQEKGKRYKWVLENGSLLVMQGEAQKLYTHEIPKEAKVKDPRISITFRQLVY